MARPLQPYHYAWLSKHPERTKDWLRFALNAGFDIHHLDGDHDNNDPENLVLIEHIDHMRLHGMTKGFRTRLKAAQERRAAEMLEEGRLAYEAATEIRRSASYSSGIWIEAGRQSGVGGKAHARARLWAEKNDLEWPLLVPNRARRKAAG